jgi:hypothetical protein
MVTKTQGWSAGLTRSVALKDGSTLRTLADARAFILREPQQIQERQTWQQAAQLLMEGAEDGRGIEVATKQVELALFLEGRLALRRLDRQDVKRVPKEG